MIHPSSSLHSSRPSPILSYIELKAKRKAEYEDKALLLAEAGRLLPQQALPGSNPALIGYYSLARSPARRNSDTPHGVADLNNDNHMI